MKATQSRPSRRIDAPAAKASDPRTVTVVLAVGDDEATIRQCVDSIAMQEYDAPIEILLVHRFPSNSLLEIIRLQLGDRFPLTVMPPPEAREGHTEDHALDLGLWLFDAARQATGGYVAPIRASDYWTSPTVLAELTWVLESRRECFACASRGIENDVATHAFTERTVRSGFVSAEDLLGRYALGHLSGVVFRKAALQAVPRDIFRLAHFERFVLAAAARTGVVGQIGDIGVVERSAGSRDAAIERDTIETAAGAALVSLADFDLLTDGALRHAVRVARKRIIRDLSPRDPPPAQHRAQTDEKD